MVARDRRRWRKRRKKALAWPDRCPILLVDRPLPDSGSVRPWIEAAANVWMRRYFHAIPGDPEALFLRFLSLARAQYGAELARSRLRERHTSKRTGQLAKTEVTLAQAADVHAFLVSAALYWWTLRKTVDQVTKPDLRPLFADYEAAANAAKTAREHMEHLDTRIRNGRDAGRLGRAMPADVFGRQSERLTVNGSCSAMSRFRLTKCSMRSGRLRARLRHGFKTRQRSS